MSQLNVDRVVSLSGGGGTAQFQLESSGNFNFDSGTLYVDSANNEVGINTTNPRSNLDIAGTGSVVVPVGTTAQRPGSPVQGMFRYNSTDGTFEGYSLNSTQINPNGDLLLVLVVEEHLNNLRVDIVIIIQLVLFLNLTELKHIGLLKVS